MDREQYRTPDEDVVEEFGRVLDLLQQARSKILFAELMKEASSKGLNWIQGLEYVIEQQRSLG